LHKKIIEIGRLLLKQTQLCKSTTYRTSGIWA